MNSRAPIRLVPGAHWEVTEAASPRLRQFQQAASQDPESLQLSSYGTEGIALILFFYGADATKQAKLIQRFIQEKPHADVVALCMAVAHLHWAMNARSDEREFLTASKELLQQHITQMMERGSATATGEISAATGVQLENLLARSEADRRRQPHQQALQN